MPHGDPLTPEDVRGCTHVVAQMGVEPFVNAAYGTSAFRDVRPSNGKLAVVRNDYVNSIDASGGIVTSLRSLDHDSSLSTANGYDNVTGVGTPNGASFLAALSAR